MCVTYVSIYMCVRKMRVCVRVCVCMLCARERKIERKDDREKE